MKITPSQDQVLALISAGSSISGAAEAAGLHRNTIHHWVRSGPQFRFALVRAREAKALYWREQAEQLAAAALDTIRAIMTDSSHPAAVRLKAALSIINIATVPPLETLPTYAPAYGPEFPAPESVHNSAQSPALGEPTAEMALPDPQPECVHNSAQQPFHRDTPKTGRNDLCPCGSGQKYKRCCLGKAACRKVA